MTRIVFYEKEGLLTEFEISGHTEKADYGKDVLCAAISVASQMTVFGLQEELKLKPFVDMYDGYLNLKLNQEDINRPEVQILMRTCLDFLKELSKKEKKFMKLEVKNV